MLIRMIFISNDKFIFVGWIRICGCDVLRNLLRAAITRLSVHHMFDEHYTTSHLLLSHTHHSHNHSIIYMK